MNIKITDFEKESAATFTSEPSVPEKLPPFRIKDYPATQLTITIGGNFPTEYDTPNIRVIGVGPLGARMVQLLSSYLPAVTFHEVLPNVESVSSDDIDVLSSSLTKSDLVIIITAFEAEYCELVSRKIGRMSCEAGVLTLAVTPEKENAHEFDPSDKQHKEWFTTMFRIPEIPPTNNLKIISNNLENSVCYSIQQLVSTITKQMTQETCIGVDFADIITVMHEGSRGKIGIGTAESWDDASTAATRAIEHLSRQGVDISTATGILADVHGSSEFTMNGYDAACIAIHAQISADANILCGLIIDEQLGNSVKVTILTVH